MKTIEEILSYKSQTLDGRDLGRLAEFMTVEQLSQVGITLDPDEKWVVQEYTRDSVLDLLKRDLAFAFEKALNQRGISAGMMFSVVKMWMWVLDEHEDLINWSDDNYAQYGLPLLKAVAIRYGLDNPIGDDNGDEVQYSSGYGEY